MKAYLVCKIEFKGVDNTIIVLEQDTEVYIDTNEEVAYANGIHFDIMKHEYIVVQ